MADAAIDATADAAIDGPGDPPIGAPVPDGLVVWLPMDEAADDVVLDATSHHYDGECDGTACPSLVRPGKIGNAYSFDADDFVRIDSAVAAQALKTSSAFTVAVWIAFDAGNGTGCVINKVLGPAAGNSWQGCLDKDVVVFYSDTAQATHTQSGGTVLTPGAFHHIVLWWNGSTKRTYIDGVLDASDPGIAIDFDERPVTLGADLDSSVPAFHFKGRIDDVRIYNRALVPSEIDALQAR